MWASAWPLVLLAVAAGLAQHSDDTATTTFVTDVDLAAVTEATTIIPDVPMTTVVPVVTKPNASGVPVDELMIVAKLNGAADGAAAGQQDTRARRLLVPGAVVVPLDPNTRLPPPSTLPSLDGDAEEDFMEDMQEIEQGSDMVMAERSAAPVAPVPQHQDQEDVLSLSDPLPLNHKKSRRDFSPSDTNSLAGKQHRFVTVAPPEQDIEKKKYERMMAKLPVRDYPGYNITGRDKPLNVVFVFPRVSEGNQTRPRELEVVLVFPQANASTAAPSATEATTTSTSVPSVSVVDEAPGVDDSDDKLELASERKETRESAPSHLTANDITIVPSKATSTVATPTTSEPTTAATTTSPSTSTTTPSTTPAPVTTTSTTPVPTSTTTVAVPTPIPAFHRWKQEPGAYRQDIYKKYANKYASSRPPPVSFFRKENASVATRRTGDDDGDLDTGASEVRHAVNEAPWAAARRRAPAPVYIPARMHAARPPPHFPSLPPTGMQPMLIVVPPLAAKAINDTLPTAAESATLPEMMPETLPDAISITPETSTLVPITPAPAVLVPAVPVSRGHARRGRPRHFNGGRGRASCRT
ncbi:mucin-17-like [Frankliniella occidentalis]|uniref:Mucin-17-like n=1 Tax=Frankliniella occidentalis TaxID=133901 RepID=A0A9C6WMX8_FRAOC|nr:mucin-17-like [Frankliniella occidentalis]